jgi:transglutaminase-like putative cysteine protease
MPIYSIQHITKYEYDALVIDSINQIKIYPYQSADQQVIEHQVIVSHNPPIALHTDYWGNNTGIFTLTEPHKKMAIESRLTVQTETGTPHDVVAPSIVLQYDYRLPDQIQSTEIIHQILESSGQFSVGSQQWAVGNGQTANSPLPTENCPLPTANQAWAIADFCNRYIFENFTYQKGITTIETTVDEILKYKKGVCQDFAHLLLQLLRTAGIICRYVSGYICPNKNGMRGEGATHAWIEIWLEGQGWLGLDPTNNLWVSNSHVRLAVGRTFDDCSPAKGTFKGLANQKLSVFVSIGYEDGNKFEDQNLVTMQPERTQVPVIIPKHHHAQQQQ